MEILIADTPPFFPNQTSRSQLFYHAVSAAHLSLSAVLRTRTAKANAATLRLSKLHYYRGEYLESRRLLEDCKADMEGDRNFTEEVLAFQEILDNRIQRDGKIGLMILSGLVAIGGLFYMYKRKDAAKEPKQ